MGSEKTLLTLQQGKDADVAICDSDEIRYSNDCCLHSILRNNANLQNWHLGYKYTYPGRALTELL